MVAEIVEGERDWADVLFLIAMVLSIAAAIMAWPEQKLTNTLGWLAVAAVSLGWLLL